MKKLFFLLVLAACTANPHPRPKLPGDKEAKFVSTKDSVILFEQWVYNEQGHVSKNWDDTPQKLEEATKEYREVLMKNVGSSSYEHARTVRKQASFIAKDKVFTYQLYEMKAVKNPYIRIVIVPNTIK